MTHPQYSENMDLLHSNIALILANSKFCPPGSLKTYLRFPYKVRLITASFVTFNIGTSSLKSSSNCVPRYSSMMRGLNSILSKPAKCTLT